MELKLNIYKDNKVEKTYCINDWELTTGVVDLVLESIDVEKIIGDNGNVLSGTEYIKFVMKSYREYQPIIQKIFPEMTDDEYKRAAMIDVSNTIFSVINIIITRLMNIADDKKK